MSACYCIGPQRGQPLCPCQMRAVRVRGGRYIMPERDLGPAPNQDTDLTEDGFRPFIQLDKDQDNDR